MPGGDENRQDDGDNLETDLIISVLRMIGQYRCLVDDPFWVDWNQREKQYYRSGKPHLTMPAELREEVVRILINQGPQALFNDAPPELRAHGLTPRQAILTSALAKMAFIYLTRADAQYFEDTDDGIMDNMCMSAGENSYSVLDRLGLIEGDSRFANWTEKGREIVRLAKDDIVQLIEDDYSAEFLQREGERHGEKSRLMRLRQYENKMKLWLFR